MPLFPQLAMRICESATVHLCLDRIYPGINLHQLGFVITATHVQNTDLHEDDLWAELRINETLISLSMTLTRSYQSSAIPVVSLSPAETQVETSKKVRLDGRTTHVVRNFTVSASSRQPR